MNHHYVTFLLVSDVKDKNVTRTKVTISPIYLLIKEHNGTYEACLSKNWT